MRDWLWRLAFVAVWVGLFAASAWWGQSVFGYMCEDCIGSRPGYFGEGGFKVDWETVILVSLVNATVLTGLVAWGSRALRRGLDSPRG